MNPEPGRSIGEGGCAEVRVWEPGRTIIKLAKSNTSRWAMEREYRNQQQAWNQGLSVPRPYELLETDGRPGIISDYIQGQPLIERLFGAWSKEKAPGYDEAVPDYEGWRITARLLAELHRVPAPQGLASQKENFAFAIRNAPYLTDAEKERVLEELRALPDSDRFCHGDPNPGNILLPPEGRPVIIDWMDASCGHPGGDLAEYVVMIRYAVLPPFLPEEAHRQFDAVREEMIDQFHEEYEACGGISRAETEPWLLPIAARKLNADAISEEEKQRLIAFIRSKIGGDNAGEEGV
ncbi:phosphotransferase family protein [Paenibacillus glufosinatiresistens]|uniref:phosphotransferase family protein n=1 Tax=Paenibacillus glufosinatiresistens TaxID=3070657 RepID=UPI00286DF0FE|nr:aminoglycoside phosphotransferase family protein [Paenibacillus sp. YX.27]